MKLSLFPQKNASIKYYALLTVLITLVIGTILFGYRAVAQTQNPESQNTVDPVIIYSDSKYTQDLSKISATLHKDNFIKEWTVSSVQKALTMSTLSRYSVHLKSISNMFTMDGLNSFNELIDINRVDDFVRDNFLHTHITFTGNPEIVAQGVMEDTYYQWTVAVPVEITYVKDQRYSSKGNQDTNTQIQKTSVDWNLVLIVVRDNNAPNPFGIAFKRWIQS